MIDIQKAVKVTEEFNILTKKAVDFRKLAEHLEKEGDCNNAAHAHERADKNEWKAQYLIESFFFPERFAEPADAEEAA